MNLSLNLLIVMLIALGILMSENDWNNLNSSQQEQYYQQIITEDIGNF